MHHSAVKHEGRVYTPKYLVLEVLDFVGYNNTEGVLRKHVIDNSCGDGAFLREIVRVYCESYLEENRDDLATLKAELEEFIHGVEIDAEEAEKCRNNLTADVESLVGLSNISWDIRTADALTVQDFDGKMDFVLGNPPYVRVHNLDASYDAVKNFTFAKRGMTDLFIVFFELSLRMLRDGGKMSLITPSSWLASNAGRDLRQYVAINHNLTGVIDLGHFQAFENATTYSLVSCFVKGRISKTVDYSTFNEKTLHRDHKADIGYGDFQIDGKFYFADNDSLTFLREVRGYNGRPYVKVKNGFATLADKVFFGDFDFSEGTIDVLKASTGKWTKGIYPYDKQGKAIPLHVIEKGNPPLFKYLLANKSSLRNHRDIEGEENWYLYGRTQALNDVGKEKIAINTIIRGCSDIKLNTVPAGAGLYSGLYILSDLNFEQIRAAILSQEFERYIKTLKNYKSGGYYSFSSRDLELFLNYQLNKTLYDQPGIYPGTFTLVS